MKVDKKLLPFIGLAAAGIVIVGAFLFSRNSSGPLGGGAKQMGGSGNSFAGTFADLFSLGQNYTCNYSFSGDDGSVASGTVYMTANGDKMNSKFELTPAGGSKMEGYVIRDGEYNYIWTSMESMGYKTKIVPEDDSVFGSDDSESADMTGLSDQNEFDFDCFPWVVDNSKFTPPSNVEFVDLEAAMEQMQESIDCSVCDNLPEGEAQDQCLQSLGC